MKIGNGKGMGNWDYFQMCMNDKCNWVYILCLYFRRRVFVWSYRITHCFFVSFCLSSSLQCHFAITVWNNFRPAVRYNTVQIVQKRIFGAMAAWTSNDDVVLRNIKTTNQIGFDSLESNDVFEQCNVIIWIN